MTIFPIDRAYAEQKLRSALVTIENLLASDWPYEDSRSALLKIKDAFLTQYNILLELDPETPSDILSLNCEEAKSLVYRYKGFMGLILRSSNVRNAFEIYNPIKRLGIATCGNDISVVISSEWSYVPFVYPKPSELLSNCIFFGLPATESQNALLTPLAGHELGHAVWRRHDNTIDREISSKLKEKIINLYYSSQNSSANIDHSLILEQKKQLEESKIWTDSHKYSLRQCEELFCDVFALWIFGESFAHAFRYLLVPNIGDRSKYYPSNCTRAKVLHGAAKRFGDKFNLDLLELFDPSQDLDDNSLLIADMASDELVEGIIKFVDDFCREKLLSRPTKEGTEIALQKLRTLAPVSGNYNIGDLLNAAWSLRQNLEAWKLEGVKDDRKADIINELVYKSFEVVEWDVDISAPLD